MCETASRVGAGRTSGVTTALPTETSLDGCMLAGRFGVGTRLDDAYGLATFRGVDIELGGEVVILL